MSASPPMLSSAGTVAPSAMSAPPSTLVSLGQDAPAKMDAFPPMLVSAGTDAPSRMAALPPMLSSAGTVAPSAMSAPPSTLVSLGQDAPAKMDAFPPMLVSAGTDAPSRMAALPPMLSSAGTVAPSAMSAPPMTSFRLGRLSVIDTGSLPLAIIAVTLDMSDIPANSATVTHPAALRSSSCSALIFSIASSIGFGQAFVSPPYSPFSYRLSKGILHASCHVIFPLCTFLMSSRSFRYASPATIPLLPRMYSSAISSSSSVQNCPSCAPLGGSAIRPSVVLIAISGSPFLKYTWKSPPLLCICAVDTAPPVHHPVPATA